MHTLHPTQCNGPTSRPVVPHCSTRMITGAMPRYTRRTRTRPSDGSSLHMLEHVPMPHGSLQGGAHDTSIFAAPVLALAHCERRNRRRTRMSPSHQAAVPVWAPVQCVATRGALTRATFRRVVPTHTGSSAHAAGSRPCWHWRIASQDATGRRRTCTSDLHRSFIHMLDHDVDHLEQTRWRLVEGFDIQRSQTASLAFPWRVMLQSLW